MRYKTLTNRCHPAEYLNDPVFQGWKIECKFYEMSREMELARNMLGSSGLYSIPDPFIAYIFLQRNVRVEDIQFLTHILKPQSSLVWMCLLAEVITSAISLE